jgi:hypothetical protein
MPGSVAAKLPLNRRQRQQELLRDPLVRKATELFDAEIVTVLDPPISEENAASGEERTEGSSA